MREFLIVLAIYYMYRLFKWFNKKCKPEDIGIMDLKD